MSQNEILTMKPGRDLDIKVAVTVMDYVWLKHLLQFSAELAVKWLGTATDLKESSGMYVVVPESQFAGLKERENHAEAVCNFSTDMEAAKQVVVRMQELGYEYQWETKGEEGDSLHYVGFKKPEELGAEPIGFTSLPEAIVKAALMAYQTQV